MVLPTRATFPHWILVAITAVLMSSCGGGGYGGGTGGGNPPSAPTGLTATAGVKQVSLTWSASSGATSYNVKRATTSGGPYTQVANTTVTNDTDGSLTGGTKYYYVVTAVNANGESANSTEVSATPVASATLVHVSIDALTNRHAISPYVYGGSYPKDAPTVTDSGMSVVRWGGNGTSTYNWQLHTNNADNDYYWEDFNANGFGNNTDGDSVQFITDVKAAGGNPLMTMPMLGWVAKSAEVASPPNGHWSFSVAKYGAQCSVDQYNTDAGNGQQTNCTTNLATNADPNDAYFQLLDDHSGTCALSGTCVYRNDWAAAMATAFGSAPHFYNMDNEIDIWGGTHRDIHPLESGYNELRDTYLSEARALKTWDPAAIRLGPVSCCWYFYWNLNSGTDNKSTHAGIDFLPWWLNEVAWSDAVAGTRSLDVFDIHAYPDADTGGLSQTQLQALATSIYRDWWDPTFPSAAHYIVQGGFSIEPVDSNPFRIPRMRALVNQIYPGTQFSITEWSAAFAGTTPQTREADFSTALGDADAYGILGRERVDLASRWTAPDPANPNYQALKLFTNYDGAHHGFATTSVSDTNDGDPNLFSSYAAVNAAGTQMTILALNKDPVNTVSAQFAINGFTPGSFVSYVLASTNPTTITSSPSSSWSSIQTLAPYTAMLLVITGTTAATPASAWDLNPDTTMVAAGGTVTLSPKITSGTASVSLGAPTADSGITVTVTQGNLTTSQNGTITVVAGNTPGFYHYSVPGTDSGATQTQGGYIVVGKPAATLAKTTGDGQTGTHGTALPTPLTVTLSPGSSGGTKTGASVLFSTSAGSLSNGTTSGPKLIGVTNSSGVASVTLTLPSTTGTVTVTAEGPYGLGHPVVTPFTETSN